MYEHKTQPLLPRRLFYRRLAASASIGLLFIVGSLVAGMIGYHALEGLSWVDSFLNASMLLGGQGPLDHPRNDPGKIFEGLYALYCGLAVLSAAGIMFAPVVHRFLHRIHRDMHGEPHEAGRGPRSSR
jgi:hypothetical protein